MLNTPYSNAELSHTPDRIVERVAAVMIALSISFAMIAETVSVPLSF